MDNWRDWPKRAKLAKKKSGKSDADLAALFSPPDEINDGGRSPRPKRETALRKAGRAQVNHWFTGTREPTISQFMMICKEIGADPKEILFGGAESQVTDENQNRPKRRLTRSPLAAPNTERHKEPA